MEGCDNEKQKENAVVIHCYAAAEPIAMMVLAGKASIANSAMDNSMVGEDIANWAEFWIE